LSESSADLARFIARLPKAELHVHLEGSMGPELLLDLARRRKVRLPADDVEGLRRWFRFRDFEHFLEIYLICSRCLREPEDFARLLLDFARVQAAQNVIYCEAHFTISTHVANGANGDEVADALGGAIVAARQRFGVTIGLIPDIVRNLAPAAADVTLQWALDHRRRGVVALGLAGMEGPPVAPFGAHFQAARAAGLRTTAHAGEQRGPESIREVLDVCRPERIGHGIAAARDPLLLAELVRLAVPLEVCPTSNVCLGYVPRLEEHPFDALYRAGAAVTVNSDDPPLFGTSLNNELASLARVFGYSRRQLAALARAAFSQAFVDADLRRALLTRFDRHVAALAADSC
jgi:adenosine deaminase